MGGKKITTRTIKRKNEPTHPDSRRAAQLARAAHRTNKLSQQRSVRKETLSAKSDRLFNLVILLPPEITHLATLHALHEHVAESFLARNDEELASLTDSRRAGRPPSKREVDLRTLTEREKDEYRTGFEVPDLTNEINVRLLREWDGDTQAIPMFRIVRISQTFPDQCTVVQAGRHKELLEQAKKEAAVVAETAMAVDV